MLSRELDEAIFTLRDTVRPNILIDSVLANKLSDLLLVSAATGGAIQSVAEIVARDIIGKTKQEQGKIELRNV
jgi:hypothetical protein